MNSRIRVKTALEHKKPDRVPTFIRANFDIKQHFSESELEYINSIVDVGPYINMDSSTPGDNADCNGIVYDELGIGRVYTGEYWEIAHHPLADMTDYRQLYDYPWPDVEQPHRISKLRSKALSVIEAGKILPVMGSWGGSTCIFEVSWYMRGLEAFLIDCMTDIKFAETLLAIQTELHKKRWSMILKEIGDIADIVCIGDDLGTQNSLIISPTMYKALIKPRHKEIVQHIKGLTKASVYYHSCGAIEPIIDDLLDIGIDILDPIQPQCLNLDKMKQKYGKDLVFYGGIDEQHVLPFSSVDEVKREVFNVYESLGCNGGLILGSAHWIQRDTPKRNIIAMYEAIEQCS